MSPILQVPPDAHETTVDGAGFLTQISFLPTFVHTSTTFLPFAVYDVVVLAFLQESPLRAAEATLGRVIIATRQSTAVALVTKRREGFMGKQ
jgi:hypothetical protein